MFDSKALNEFVSDFMNMDNSIIHPGVVTDIEIEKLIYMGEMYISPFNSDNLTAAAYNVSASDIIISTKRRLPLSIHELGSIRYVNIDPHDTVLIETYEAVYTNNHVVGTIHSRVGFVSNGFGHISTTIDPNWKGPLLIALTNQSSKRKRFVIEENSKRTAFATVIFYYVPAEHFERNLKPPMRTDILIKNIHVPKGIKRLLTGRAHIRYSELIRQLESVYATNTIKSNLTDYIQSVEKTIQEIRDNYISHGFIGDRKLLSEIETVANKAEHLHLLPEVCINLLWILLLSIKGYDSEMNKSIDRGKIDQYNNRIIQILDQIIVVLCYERQSAQWLNAHSECSKTISNREVTSWWTKAILIIPWWRIIFTILLVVGIGIVIYFMSKVDLDNQDISYRILETVLVALLSTLGAGVLSFVSNRK